MTYLLFQIFLSLLGALLIGVVATWYFQRVTSRRREELIQQDYRSRLRQVELDRDQSVKNLSAELAKVKKSRNEKQDSSVVGDRAGADDKRIVRLEEKVLERETAISDLRTEIQGLREQLEAEKAHAVEKETALILEHDEQLKQLQSEQNNEEQEDNDQRLAELKKQHAAELESQAQELALQARQQFEQELAEVRTQHASAVAELEDRINAQAANDLEQQLEDLKKQHASAIAELENRVAADDVEEQIRQHEQALIAKHQAEIASFRQQPQAGTGLDSSGQDAVVRKLQSEIQLRDDSISVLRDDLAELRNNENIASRGRQDELLRGAMADALEWQEKYETLKAQTSTDAKAQSANDYETTATEPLSTARSGLDRIASAVSGVEQQRDNLQAIRGVGPVMEKTLNDQGVFSYRQIAEFESADIEKLEAKLGRFSGRIKRDDWVGQALALQRKHYG